jgi:hypothetical protein
LPFRSQLRSSTFWLSALRAAIPICLKPGLITVEKDIIEALT